MSTRAGRERDLVAGLGLGVPVGERLDVLRADRLPVLVAQQVLEQDLQRERQPRDVVTAPAARRGGRSRSSRPPTSSVALASKLFWDKFGLLGFVLP